MGEEEPKRAVEHKRGPSSEAEEERHHFKEPVSNDVAHQKFLNPFAHPETASPDVQKNSEDSADRAAVADPDNQRNSGESVDREVADPVVESKNCGDSVDRETVLANVEKEKRLALIKAWEENEKTKVDNKAYKRLSAVGTWENTKKAAVEVQLRRYEEKLEKKKAEYEERMKNKVAEIRREAEERRAMIEARRGEDVLKVEETAAKFRTAGFRPRKFLACFS
ncbi:Remorin family protein [Melia azedarach]|uniref:Remorin family protein n=1 Tax=Melia azedarach TaxID=155640 RepID=A0ACC1XL23_MELAZ|nr:Remorin family protein [Melia azedarach]